METNNVIELFSDVNTMRVLIAAALVFFMQPVSPWLKQVSLGRKTPETSL